jgi:hypothetical protein
MIDIICTLIHFCASCAPNANSFTPWAGLLGGGAGAAGGVGGAGGLAGDGSGAGAGAGAGGGNGGPGNEPWNSGLLGKGAGGLAPYGMGPGGLKPGDYGYADPGSPLTDPNDLPLQDDPIGNAIPGLVLGPLSAAREAAAAGLSGLKALGEASAAAGKGLMDQTFQDMTGDAIQQHAQNLESNIPEDPGTYHMGKTMTNPDGSTTNPDGTPGLPPNQSPAYNPDGTPATSDPSNPTDGS